MAVKISIRHIAPFIGYHHVLILITSIAIILLSILLAGCTTSNGLTNVYLLSLSYTSPPINVSASTPDPLQINPSIQTTFAAEAGNDTVLEVRVCYMGICMSQNSGQWLCSSDASTLANIIKSQHIRGVGGSNAGGDPLNLIWIAETFRQSIVYEGLIFTAIPLSFITLLLLATFPGWHEEEDSEDGNREVKPFPSRPVSQAALGIIAIATILVFVSALCQHVASAAASTLAGGLSYGTVSGGVGPAAMVLGWSGTFLLCVTTGGLLIMILSITLLNRLVDMEDESEDESEEAIEERRRDRRRNRRGDDEVIVVDD